MKDKFYLLCAEIRRQCDASVTKDGESLEENRAACRKAVARFDAELEPALAGILDFSGKNSPAGREAREEAAFCLHELAKNHIWAEEYEAAERLIARAKEIAFSSAQVLSRIEETATSLAADAALRADAAQKKATLREEPAKPAETPTGETRKWWPQVAAAAVAILVAAGISYNLGAKNVERRQEIAAKPAPATLPTPVQEAKTAPLKTAPVKSDPVKSAKVSQQAVAPSVRISEPEKPEKTDQIEPEIKKLAEKPETARAKAALRRRAIETPKSAARSSEARKLSVAAGFYKKGSGRVTRESLKPRIMAGITALAMLEERLTGLMRQLDDMDKGFERSSAGVEGAEYRTDVSRYYKLLREARLTADEHDRVLMGTWRLVGQYRRLTQG